MIIKWNCLFILPFAFACNAKTFAIAFLVFLYFLFHFVLGRASKSCCWITFTSTSFFHCFAYKNQFNIITFLYKLQVCLSRSFIELLKLFLSQKRRQFPFLVTLPSNNFLISKRNITKVSIFTFSQPDWEVKEIIERQDFHLK